MSGRKSKINPEGRCFRCDEIIWNRKKHAKYCIGCAKIVFKEITYRANKKRSKSI